MDVVATFRMLLSGIVESCRDVVQSARKMRASDAKVGSAHDVAAQVLMDDRASTNLLSHVDSSALAELALHAKKTHAILARHDGGGGAVASLGMHAASVFYSAVLYREPWPSASDLVIHVRVGPEEGASLFDCFNSDVNYDACAFDVNSDVNITRK